MKGKSAAKMIKEEVARLLSKSNAKSDPSRHKQLLEGKLIEGVWNKDMINDTDAFGQTMLHMAVASDVDGTFLEVVKFLIDNAIDVNLSSR